MTAPALRPAPAAFAPDPSPDETPVLEAPEHLVREYLELTEERRRLEDRLAYLRAELELLAASALNEGRPRGRFAVAGGAGAVSARLQPTCVFDKPGVMKLLQREGRLADVATLPGPTLARFLAKEPVLAARLGEMVRHRKSVVLTANP